MDLRLYETLASLFDFPGPNYAELVEECRATLRDRYPDLDQQLDPFAALVGELSSHELEELFIRTFDVQALCCLDVGYVLFGEDYSRGKLLANLNREHRRAGVDCRGELADRLPNVLRLIPRLRDAEVLHDLVRYIMKPALDEMIQEFVPARMREKDEIYEEFHQAVLTKREDRVTRYRIPLQCVRGMLDIDFPEIPKIDPGPTRDYMESVKGELKHARKGRLVRPSS